MQTPFFAYFHLFERNSVKHEYLYFIFTLTLSFSSWQAGWRATALATTAVEAAAEAVVVVVVAAAAATTTTAAVAAATAGCAFNS